MTIKSLRKKILNKFSLVDAKVLDKLQDEIKHHVDYESTLIERFNQVECIYKKEIEELKATISKYDDGLSLTHESLLKTAKSLQGLSSRVGLTKKVIDRMPTDEYKNRLQNEPGFRQAVDKVLEAK